MDDCGWRLRSAPFLASGRGRNLVKCRRSRHRRTISGKKATITRRKALEVVKEGQRHYLRRPDACCDAMVVDDKRFVEGYVVEKFTGARGLALRLDLTAGDDASPD